MTRVLIVSVGGSPDPILKAVELHAPDEVIFVCSAPPCERPSLDQVIGEGMPCRHLVAGQEIWRPNLVTQLGLQGFRENLQLIGLPDPDDLNDCLRRLRSAVKEIRKRTPDFVLFGDYTGGTKSMSAALTHVLLENSAPVSFVGGPRTNLTRIEQSETLRVADAFPFQAERLFRHHLKPLLELHFYDKAQSLLRSFNQDLTDQLNPQQSDVLQQLLSQLEVFGLWDRYQWQAALDLAEDHQFQSAWGDLWSWWLRVEEAKDWRADRPATPSTTGYELVQDLLLNAERRGRRGWYDDAVARLYRASELLAQTYIRLDLSADDADDMQTWLDLGARKLYQKIVERELQHRRGRGDIGLGVLYNRQRSEMDRLFSIRNRSLLGHGLSPITEAEWRSLQDRTTNLVNGILGNLGYRQEPPPQQLPGATWLSQPLVQELLTSQP
jgi:CRISPR-associated protein (TIGR02710 family)